MLLFILVHISRRWGPIIAPEAKTVVRLAISDSVPAMLSACSEALYLLSMAESLAL